MMFRRIRRTLFLVMFSLPVLAVSAQQPEKFAVHFSVLSQRDVVVNAATREALAHQVELLNEHFKSADGQPLAQFSLHSISLRHEIADTHCTDLLQRIDSPVPTSKVGYHDGAVCTDVRVVHPGAINVFLVDTYSEKNGWGELNSYGSINSYLPFITLDYMVLSRHKEGRIPGIVHEMGHVFGLHDEKTRGANVMESGNHTAYFRADQVAKIGQNAEKIRATLSVFDPQNLIINGSFEALNAYWNFDKANFTKRNAHAGKVSAELLPGMAARQKVRIRDGGNFVFSFMGQATKPGSRVTLRLNDRDIVTLEIAPGKDMTYKKYEAARIVLQPGDALEVSVSAAGIARVDDFLLRRGE